jgi:2-C-methyl-D-erythritol 4-phosphate cytidylyltransferase
MAEPGWRGGDGRGDRAAAAPSEGVWCIVLAAGAATRFGAPKQLLPIGGLRCVDLVVLTASSTCDRVVLVLPREVPWDGAPVEQVVTGGGTRSVSVRAGLAVVDPAAQVVVVHDAAHPLASVALFQEVIAAVRQGADAAMPGLPVAETLKRVDAGWVTGTIPRAGVVLSQTPHAFAPAVLRAVHAGDVEVVEDTVAVEAAGGRVRVVPGDPVNVHITTPADLRVAEALARHPGVC